MRALFFIAMCCLIAGCQKEVSLLGTNVDETIFLRSNSNDMPVRIIGNTSSKVLILFVHGGPCYAAWPTITPSMPLTEHYGVAYWDQRGSGSAQSNDAGKFTLSAFVQDMDGVITLLNSLFDTPMDIYIWSHSWGGAISTVYLSSGMLPANIKGWINMDGVTNPIAQGPFIREDLSARGPAMVESGNSSSLWNTWMQWCNDHPAITTFEEFSTINSFAWEAQGTFPDVYKFSDYDATLVFRGQQSVMSHLTNNKSLQKNNFEFLEDIFLKTDLSLKYSSITIPTLVLWGKYDMVAPLKMATTFMDSIGSTDKTLILLDHSDHTPISCEPHETCSTIKNFIERIQGKDKKE